MKVTQTVERHEGATEYVYEYEGITVILVHDKDAGHYHAYLISGSYANPHDQEVEGQFATKKEAQAAAQKMIDDEIEEQVRWEEENLREES